MKKILISFRSIDVKFYYVQHFKYQDYTVQQ
jgi:hypothetical protein